MRNTQNVEREILILMCQGYHYSQMADKLKLSIETVKEYSKKYYQKLGVKNRKEVIRWFNN